MVTKRRDLCLVLHGPQAPPRCIISTEGTQKRSA